MTIIFALLHGFANPSLMAETASGHIEKAAAHLEHFCADIADREVISFYDQRRCKEISNALDAASLELSKELIQIKKDIASLKKK
ncbi:MAG: hypothetical protein KA715_05705 [Xanthomonadaceae bacterium]|nr:hypothetical protein [Xanthomonadaceae bacterium]